MTRIPASSGKFDSADLLRRHDVRTEPRPDSGDMSGLSSTFAVWRKGRAPVLQAGRHQGGAAAVEKPQAPSGTQEVHDARDASENPRDPDAGRRGPGWLRRASDQSDIGARTASHPGAHGNPAAAHSDLCATNGHAGAQRDTRSHRGAAHLPSREPRSILCRKALVPDC